MRKAIDIPENVMKSIKHSFFERPHHRAMAWTVLILIVSGVPSVVIYENHQAISAILASISAGCITGIVFYVISNIRNNEIRATIEEFESIAKVYDLARDTMRLCTNIKDRIIQNATDYQSELAQLINNTNDLLRYMATMCFDIPKATKAVKDFTPAYVERVKAATSSIDYFESHADELNKDQTIEHLCSLLLFYADTKSILLEPWIQLLQDVHYYENTII